MLDIDSLCSPACVVSDSGAFLFVNAAFSTAIAGRTLRASVFDYCRHDIYRAREFRLSESVGGQLEVLLFDVEYSASVLDISDGADAAFLLVLSRKQQSSSVSPALQNKVLQYSVDCIKVVRADGTLEFMNRAGCLALGVDVGERVFGFPWLDLLPADVREVGRRAIGQAIAGAAVSFPGRSEAADGTVIHWNNLLSPVDDPVTGERKVVCVSRDVTAEVTAKARLKALSETDELTGLGNRRRFHEALCQLPLTERRPTYLMILDVDGFKSINDGHGHHVGDAVLQSIAGRLLAYFPSDALVCRLGGDEFAVMLDAGGGVPPARERLIEELASLAQPPFEFDGTTLECGISAGYVLWMPETLEADAALRCADSALRRAKAAGKARVFSYDGADAPQATLGLCVG